MRTIRETINDKHILCWSNTVKFIFTIGGLLAVSTSAYLLYSLPPEEMGDMNSIIFCNILTAFVVTILLIEVFTVTISLDSSGIIAKGWGRTRKCTWKEINFTNFIAGKSRLLRICTFTKVSIDIPINSARMEILKTYFTQYLEEDIWKSTYVEYKKWKEASFNPFRN